MIIDLISYYFLRNQEIEEDEIDENTLTEIILGKALYNFIKPYEGIVVYIHKNINDLEQLYGNFILFNLNNIINIRHVESIVNKEEFKDGDLIEVFLEDSEWKFRKSTNDASSNVKGDENAKEE